MTFGFKRHTNCNRCANIYDMKRKGYLLILTAVLLVAVSCKKYKHEEFGNDMAKAFKSKKYKDFDTTAYFAVFKEQLKAESENIKNPKWLKKIYSSEDKGLTLIGHFLVTGEIDSLNWYLQASRYHGLNPEYFKANEIAGLLEAVKNTKWKKVEDSYPSLAKLELYCADGLINYSNILKYGAVNPKKLYGRYYVAVKRPDMIESQKALEQIDMMKFLESVQPKNGYYKRLQNVLINKQRISAEEREKVYLTMERLRWPAKSYPAKYLLVNIPEMKLRLIENNTSDLEMKVCVGETANEGFSKSGKNHETPILSGTIDRMQVNPVWNIPKSIAGNEILVSLRKNSAYLDENNMVAYNKAGEVVNPYDVNWGSASAEDYAFKQNPGADNSLGRIKFIFQNPYAIYLHDTPAQAMFGQSNRAVSHGCVRVEKPMVLASFLLDNEKEAARIKKETSSAEAQSRWVMIKKPVPVFIAYYTAWAKDNGELISAPDVYGYDAKLKPVFAKYMF